MLKKTVSKWTFAFLAGFILTMLIISMAFIFPGLFRREICPRGQEREIQNVWIKVEEMRGKVGHETMYFEVKDCVEEINYDGVENITVKYTTAETPVEYPTNADWLEGWKDCAGGPMHLDTPGTYYFRVSEDCVEVS